MPCPKHSSDIRAFSKRTQYQRKPFALENKGNVPSNDIKSDLIFVTCILLVKRFYIL